MFLVLLMYALFASVFTIGKVGLDVSEPFFLTGVRMLLAGLAMLGWQVVANPSECRAPFKVWPLLILVAIFNVFITNAFEFWGLQYMLSSKTCLIYSLSPFAAVFLSYLFLGETMSPLKWLGMLIGIAAFIPLFANPWMQTSDQAASSLEHWAELALTISAVTAVIGWIFVKKLTIGMHYSALMVNAISFILGSVCCFAVSAATETWAPFPVTDWNTFWICIVYIALIHNIICYSIYAYSLNKFSVTFIAFAGLSNPLFTAIYGWYFLSEPLTAPFFIAIAGAAIGLGLFYREEKRTSLASIASCLVVMLTLTSCESASLRNEATWKTIQDRIDRPLYHAAVPTNWVEMPRDPAEKLSDTTFAIATWQIDDVKITLHTFPVETLENRIPPQSQVSRWIKQLHPLDEESVRIEPAGHSGYLGLFVEAEGETTGLLAWSMQLAPEHFLSFTSLVPLDVHLRADYTIKAVGPKEALARQRESILSFAQSFEMMDEIPQQ